MTKDKKCLNCSRMTVSQDEYISGMQEKIHDLEKENAELKEKQRADRQCEACKLGDLIVENAKLKKEISVLLSCSNCSENKGGYVCEKEYNDKCLAQKIEYIKELKEEIEKMKCCGNCSKRNECTMNVLDRLLCDKWSWLEKED